MSTETAPPGLDPGRIPHLRAGTAPDRGPAAPQDRGPTAPPDRGPTAPPDPGPAAPQDRGPAAPQDRGPTAPPDQSAHGRRAVMEDFSLEMTGRDVAGLAEARDHIPPGTRINVTFLANEDLRTRLNAARAIRKAGFVPVPHISARRLSSRGELEEFLAALQNEDASENVFVVAGDPAEPRGPYEDALAVIKSGLLQAHGVRHIGISGYPEGHPDISEARLWEALEAKASIIKDGSVITQFGFDAAPVLDWIEGARQRGISLPVRVGVPGPAGIKRLLSYAKRFGVSTSAGIAKKYGFSITNLMGTAGPERFIQALQNGYDPDRHGEVKLHFYTFGGLKATAEWIAK